MSELDQPAITIGEVGEGEWELTPEGGETIEARLNDVEVDENRGLGAGGRNEEEEEAFLVELTTGPQPGGSIRRRRRGLTGDEWEAVGELADANRLDRRGYASSSQ